MNTERVYRTAADRDADNTPLVLMARRFESALRARTDTHEALLELAMCMGEAPRRSSLWLALMCQRCADVHGCYDTDDELARALRRHDLDAVLDALAALSVPEWRGVLVRLWTDALPLGIGVQLARALEDRYDD